MNLKLALVVINVDAEHVTKDELKRVYASKLRFYHPDKGGNANDYHLLQEAYQVIYRHIRSRSDAAVPLESAVDPETNSIVGVPDSFHTTFENSFVPSRRMKGYNKDELDVIPEIDVTGLTKKNFNERFDKHLESLSTQPSETSIVVTAPEYSHATDYGMDLMSVAINDHSSRYGADIRKLSSMYITRV